MCTRAKHTKLRLYGGLKSLKPPVSVVRLQKLGRYRADRLTVVRVSRSPLSLSLSLSLEILEGLCLSCTPTCCQLHVSHYRPSILFSTGVRRVSGTTRCCRQSARPTDITLWWHQSSDSAIRQMFNSRRPGVLGCWTMCRAVSSKTGLLRSLIYRYV